MITFIIVAIIKRRGPKCSDNSSYSDPITTTCGLGKMDHLLGIVVGVVFGALAGINRCERV
jgi:hypothetical protein